MWRRGQVARPKWAALDGLPHRSLDGAEFVERNPGSRLRLHTAQYAYAIAPYAGWNDYRDRRPESNWREFDRVRWNDYRDYRPEQR